MKFNLKYKSCDRVKKLMIAGSFDKPMRTFADSLSFNHSSLPLFLEENRLAGEFETRNRHRSLPERTVWLNCPEAAASELEDSFEDSIFERRKSELEEGLALWAAPAKPLSRNDSTVKDSLGESQDSSGLAEDILPSLFSQTGEEADAPRQTGRVRAKIRKQACSSLSAVNTSASFEKQRIYGSEKKTKLNLKVVRVRQYWTSASNFTPNVFRLTALSGEPDTFFEFQDFSQKEVMAEGIIARE